MSAMAIIAATVVMLSPFALAIALSWIARHNKTFRIHLDQFRIAAPMGGTFAVDIHSSMGPCSRQPSSTRSNASRK